MTLQRNALVAALAAVALVPGVLAVSAASQRSEPADPVAREVRDLRFAVERAAAQSVQMTLILIRAEASQSRVSSISSELGSVRMQLARTASDVASNTALLAEAERPYPNVPGEPTPAGSHYDARRQLAGLNQLEATLRARESELVGTMNREQTQWNQLVARLEALERSLGR
jgi:hypothetical protein